LAENEQSRIPMITSTASCIQPEFFFTAPSSTLRSRRSYLYGLPRKEPGFLAALGLELSLIRRRTSLLLAPLILESTPWWNYQPFPVSPLTLVEDCVAEPHSPCHFKLWASDPRCDSSVRPLFGEVLLTITCYCLLATYTPALSISTCWPIYSRAHSFYLERHLPGFMGLSLEYLPFDVLFYIGSHLDVDDVVHLHQTCSHLKQLLDESTFCRRTVEVCDVPILCQVDVD
jgi:hypothetical protein